MLNDFREWIVTITVPFRHHESKSGIGHQYFEFLKYRVMRILFARLWRFVRFYFCFKCRQLIWNGRVDSNEIGVKTELLCSLFTGGHEGALDDIGL
ncbi:hypothetical protein A2G96_08365 [Cupriavidus nantongensis]|uniref:Uncharacterized protein n=1 Tax=Cupriavidus nantongensis TaxID=1796606 RepID=A0A142JI38_9BURK|nr:hypothetical protein A2G96_08365 [Cupriavidus nantongensis]